MTKVVKPVLLVIFACLFISGISFLVHSYHTSPIACYSGQVIFRTEADYTAFKDYLSQPEVTLDEIQALTSEPPILVKYKVDVPRSWKFPYSYSNIVGVISPLLTVICAAWIAFGAVGLFMVALDCWELLKSNKKLRG